MREAMKVVIFNGSPRKGNTLTAIKAIQEGIQSRADAADIEINVIETKDKNIVPCKACNACGSMSRCIFADDSPAINEAVEAADVLIFATPVYWWGMTAQLKLVVDKFYARASKLTGSKKVGTVVIGEAELDDPEYEINATSGFKEGILRLYAERLEFSSEKDFKKEIIQYIMKKDVIKNENNNSKK